MCGCLIFWDGVKYYIRVCMMVHYQTIIQQLSTSTIISRNKLGGSTEHNPI
jgi:cephalosporin hydroxylase